MNTGFVNPSCFYTGFCDRLYHLIELKGFSNPCEKGIAKKISTEMYKNGIIQYSEKDLTSSEKAKQRDNSRKTIQVHQTTKDFRKISSEWLYRYSLYFNCSIDYLIGKINVPTYEHDAIFSATGFSTEAINVIMANNTQNSDFFTSHDILDYFIQHIGIFGETPLIDMIEKTIYEKKEMYNKMNNEEDVDIVDLQNDKYKIKRYYTIETFAELLDKLVKDFT